MARLLEIHRARLAQKAHENKPKAPEAPLLEQPVHEPEAIPDASGCKRGVLGEIVKASGGFLMTVDISPRRTGFVHYRYCGPNASESLRTEANGDYYGFETPMMDALKQAGVLENAGYPKDMKTTCVIFRRLGDLSWFGLVKVPKTREHERNFTEDERKGRGILLVMALKMPQATMEGLMTALKKEPDFADGIYRELFPEVYEHIKLGPLTPTKIVAR
jgi:hypothetical protein